MPNLHMRTNEQLMTMLHNIMAHRDRSRAEAAKRHLYNEWERRNQVFCSGQNMSLMDGDGVLSAFRYHVGDSGITNATKRQLILDHILEAPIPPVVDRKYTMKWGNPNSPERKKRLIRTLKGLVSGVNKKTSYNQDSLSRAKSHWQEDIAYLEKLSFSYH